MTNEVWASYEKLTPEEVKTLFPEFEKFAKKRIRGHDYYHSCSNVDSGDYEYALDPQGRLFAWTWTHNRYESPLMWSPSGWLYVGIHR